MPFFFIFGLITLAVTDDRLTTFIAMLFARFLYCHKTNILLRVVLLESLGSATLFSLLLLELVILINLFQSGMSIRPQLFL